MAIVGSKVLLLALCGSALAAGAARAADFDGDVLRGTDTAWTSDTSVEVGLRAWYSTGKLAKKLYTQPAYGRQLLSRLTYDGLDAYGGEAYGRVEQDDYFLKGYVGLGRIGSGSLRDEDFEPFISPYSSTDSKQKDGTLNYVSADFGYNLIKEPTYKIGIFAGVHYLDEKVNAYGCTQTATNPDVCAPGDVLSGVLAITEQARWTSARVGVNAEVLLFDRLRLGLDAAWVPYTSFSGVDHHWLRTDIKTDIQENGDGRNGVQLEATAAYQLTDDWSIGAGVRYWRMTADADAKFGVPVSSTTYAYVKEPETFVTERFGAFLQSSYKFGL
ncbi:omptin family outer membrane protease [Labrys wisconsinensis]|uniref:Protochlamydia outer membrane protein domain-containing protein n=1 Tax=Labrys wisconsinensis TaxID=425677 RepID=A0ABU0JPZ9_9HYPH|nr:omptin family outer membrane protease [Labrys wisconsinensis]MDQ0475453.1 hypothetical protein [Labrys wisconsinensis]